MKAIVACDRKRGIGKDNRLLFHIPGDLEYFRGKTLGKTLVMGRKTLESLPGGKPLPGRETVVLSAAMKETEGLHICRSAEEVLEYTKDKDVFICGGGSVYRCFLDYCDTLLITEVDAEAEADTFFPDPAAAGFRLDCEDGPFEEKGLRYWFREYVR